MVATTRGEPSIEQKQGNMSITVSIGRQSVAIARDVFVALFDNSVVSEYVGFTKALATEAIEFDELVASPERPTSPTACSSHHSRWSRLNWSARPASFWRECARKRSG